MKRAISFSEKNIVSAARNYLNLLIKYQRKRYNREGNILVIKFHHFPQEKKVNINWLQIN